MAGKLTIFERAYFVRKAGGAQPTEPLNNIKRRYMMGVVGASVNGRTPFDQLEKRWLLSVIGGAARDWESIEELWRQAVMAIPRTPAKSVEQNKMIFYQHAA